MIPKKYLALATLVGILVLTLGIGRHYYNVGRRTVEQTATQDSLARVRKELITVSNTRDSIGKELAKADSQSTRTRIIYRQDVANVQITGDSAVDSLGHFIQVLDPRISKRIKDADNHIASLEGEVARAKFLIKVDTLYIGKQSDEGRLGIKVEKLKQGGHFSPQVGVGGCYSTGGIKPCVYVGFGFHF